MTIVAPTGETSRGRPAAGHDGRKRHQILAGAYRTFMRQGFDATSMDDIAKEAGVSKGTLYVYFDSKERLFQELVREEKERQFPAIFAIDPDETDIRGALTRVGQQFARFITASHVVMATRTIIAMAERMPDIAIEFYDSGPRQCAGQLSRVFRGADGGGQARHSRCQTRRVAVPRPHPIDADAAVDVRRRGAAERGADGRGGEIGGGHVPGRLPAAGSGALSRPVWRRYQPLRRGISGAPRPSSPDAACSSTERPMRGAVLTVEDSRQRSTTA